MSPAKAYRQVINEMNSLPENTRLTYDYCNRFSGILCVDGKYVKVKGYKKKIPFIYGIDYLTHDIPVGMLVPSENEQAFLKYFKLLKILNYSLQIVICDDTSPLKSGLKHIYSKARIQMCHTHYLENIRQNLNIRTDEKYHHFFNSLIKHVFRDPKNKKEREKGLHHVYTKHVKNNEILQYILIDIAKKQHQLFAYEQVNHCPRTNNIIESYNSHLNGRLKTIKGFQSFHSAERWLNAWMIRRRTKSFTDCNTKFKYLNRRTSLEMTIKKQTSMSEIIQKYQLKMKR